MSNGRKVLFLIAVLLTTTIAYELFTGWSYANRPAEWKSLSTDTYTAEFPAHWETTEHDRYPRFDRRHMAFDSRPLNSGDDPYKRSLGVYDEGSAGQDLDARAIELRRNGQHQSPVKDIQLANGVTAKTWTGVQSTVEVGIPYRVYLFEAPNGHVYRATHDIPQGWKNEWRYNRLFRRILGSMKFKDAPAPAPLKGR